MNCTLLCLLLSPNNTYLSNTQYGLDKFNILGNKTSSIQQNYEDRMRNYNLMQSYGLNDLNDQYTYYNSMSGFHSDTFRDIYHTAYFTALNPYTQNVKDSNKNGDISKPIQVTGGAVGVLTGNANTLNISDNTKLITKTDVQNQYAEARVDSKTYNFFINYNLKNPSDRTTADTLGLERVQTGITKTLPYSFTESVTHGIITNITRNTIGYELITRVGIFYDYSFGLIPESTIRSGYGIKF